MVVFEEKAVADFERENVMRNQLPWNNDEKEDEDLETVSAILAGLIFLVMVLLLFILMIISQPQA